MGCSEFDQAIFFQLAEVSYIFLSLSLSPVSGFGQARSERYRICQKKNVSTIDIFTNASQNLPVSTLGDTNPLLNSTTGTEQTPALVIYLSAKNQRPAGLFLF